MEGEGEEGGEVVEWEEVRRGGEEGEERGRRGGSWGQDI